MDNRKLGFIGAGNMAVAMGRGILKAKLYAQSAVMAADISEPRRRLFQDDLGVRTVPDSASVVRESDVAILAVKPQHMGEVLKEIGPIARADQTLISIAAGVSTRRIEEACSAEVRVVRVMPNTPMLIGRGMSAVCGGKRAGDEDIRTAVAICEAAGKAVVVEEEAMDIVTAVSGSGPAYFFFLVERMIEAGVAEGLTPDAAAVLAKQTALGAAELMLASEDPPEELRRRVTSPGGTTEAAFRLLEDRGGFQDWVDAVRRAAERSRELAAG